MPKEKTSSSNRSKIADRPSAGPEGISIAPPAYDIESIDSATPEPRAAIQMKSVGPAAGGDTGARPENRTGLPDALKTGVESLSGLGLDDVQVHYNSSRPAQLQALAYTQGTDIHVGPGQERHIPHEAWHVVQQKQGRVKPTVQMKGGVPVNDEKQLEHEADVMGKAAATRRERLDPKATSSHAEKRDGRQPSTFVASSANSIQRKIAFSGEKDLSADNISKTYKTAADIHLRVVSAIDDNAELLKETFGDEKFDEISEELDRELAFCNNVWDLVISPIDYGEINLDNPEHVVLFFNAAGQFLNKNYEEQRELEKPEKEKQERAEKDWEDTKKLSPSPEKSYKIALLGTGASIANYLNVNGRSLDPKGTVIIGEVQPWDPLSPKSRGIGFVNHPMHMTSPIRHKTGLPEQKSGKDETFQDNPMQLTEDIKTILGRFSPPVDTSITKVSKQEDKWYKIETGAGIFYSLKVVAGLGIGPHKFTGLNKRSLEITTPEDKETETKRVMDLDTFQRALKNPESDIRKEQKEKAKRGIILLIGVAGPNAGVDAAFEATELGMGVDWVVSSGPALAEGMGNKVNNKGLVDLYFDYLKGWTILSKETVEMDISGKESEEREKSEREFSKKAPGWRISKKKTALVDYLVIAQGPEVEKVWNIFDKSATTDLTLKIDKQGRFGAPKGGKILQKPISESISERVESLLDGEDEELAKISKHLQQRSLAILEVGEFAEIVEQENVAIGLGSEDDSLEIIGGSTIRILNYLDGLKASHGRKVKDANTLEKEKPLELENISKLRTEAERILEKIPEKLRSGGTEKMMKKVIETLSSPTILNNDQLTPIRSQIEALGDYMPGYIGTEESNFVTDDQTMIAAQIASQYGDIPATLADWVTQKIIEDRHKNDVKPGTGKGSREFIDKWNNRLEKLDELFSSENIESLLE